MKIYTRRGDEGDSGLLGGGRVSKDHPRLHAYGAVDELNSFLGAARGQTRVRATAARLALIQQDLFAIGASLARPAAREGRKRPGVPDVPVDRIAEMEAWMDEADTTLAPLRNFILPGGTSGTPSLHVARSVCRRAERVTVSLAAQHRIDEGVLPYLNRLSDLLFVLARVENQASGQPDETWEK